MQKFSDSLIFRTNNELNTFFQKTRDNDNFTLNCKSRMCEFCFKVID